MQHSFIAFTFTFRQWIRVRQTVESGAKLALLQGTFQQEYGENSPYDTLVKIQVLSLG